MTEKFGKGFSERNLEQMRQFYVAYAIPKTLSAELQLSRFQLSWSHYLVLMRIEDANERGFYEIKTAANNWSLRELKRQYHSSLYERLALSRNKEEVMRLTKQGQKLEKPEDILKSPLSVWQSNIPSLIPPPSATSPSAPSPPPTAPPGHIPVWKVYPATC